MKQSIFLLFVFLSFQSIAQIDLSLSEPIANQLKLADMFSVTISNNTGAEMQVSLDGLLKTRRGEIYVKGKSNSFSLKQGITSINPSTLNISYTFFRQNIQTGSDIPYGEYVLCSTLNDGGMGVNQCIEFSVQPLTPPFLTYPENAAIIEQNSPVFMWQAPAPILRGQTILYDFSLVQILPNQTCSQASMMNNKIYFDKNLEQTQLVYPLSAIQLDTGKKYCWQVLAKTNEYSIGQTEVWEFSLRNPITKEKEKPQPFIVLKKELDAAVYQATNGKLNLLFQEPYTSKDMVYELVDLKTNTALETECLKNKIKRLGDNQFEFDFNNCQLAKGTYKLIVYNEKKDAFTAKFKIN